MPRKKDLYKDYRRYLRKAMTEANNTAIVVGTAALLDPSGRLSVYNELRQMAIDSHKMCARLNELIAETL